MSTPLNADDQAPDSAGPPTAQTEQDARILSCLRCKRRKQRCDKVLPTCTPCRKLGLECTRISRESHDRKGVITALLDHVATLEAELRAGGGDRRQTQPIGSHAPSRTPRERSANPSVGNGDGSEPRAAADAAAPSAHQTPGPSAGPATDSGVSMNHLSLSAVAEPRNRAGEFLKHLSTPRLITGVTETFGGNPESTGRVDELWEAISQYIRSPSGSTQRLYIPQDQTQKALSTYLDVVDFRYPRLPVAKVRSGMNAISAEDGETTYNELINTSPAHIFMAYLVVAIVPLVSDSYPVAQGSWVSAHLLSKCLKLLTRVFLQEDGVDIIQCLHLLIILSIHCSTAGSSWHLIGFAMNKCIALGYHQDESPSNTMLSESDVQQRRWAFWGCYLLDRLICAGLGRPFSIEDHDILVPLPSETFALERSEQRTSLAAGSDTPTQQSKLQTHAYIHLFRYAILLSSAAKETEQDAVDQSPSFDDLLGQALYWRTTSPTRGHSSIADIHAHQMSLHNTMLLRAAIREVNSAFVVVASGSEEAGVETSPQNLPQQPLLRHEIVATIHAQGQREDGPLAASTVASIFHHEKDRILRTKLIAICRAAGKSLDRSRMTSRPYLSFLTGYSSLSVGLACLYYLTVSHFPTPYENNVMMPPPLSASTNPDTTIPPSLFVNTSPPVVLGSGQQGNNRTSGSWDAEQRLYADPQALVDLACRRLEVVGRQFPRLQEYRMILEKLRSLICLWSARFFPNAEGPLMHDHIVEFRLTTNDIGPPHLKKLAEAILYLLAL